MATSEQPCTRASRRMTLLARCARARLRALYLRQQRLFSSKRAWMRLALQPPAADAKTAQPAMLDELTLRSTRQIEALKAYLTPRTC